MALALLGTLSAFTAPPVVAAGDVVAQDYIAGAWLFYRSKFLDESGRIVDDGNEQISHSEGQGMGMLLAVAADSRSDFDRLWQWTRRNLMVRDDALAAWRWDPHTPDHVADLNNATDGDLLIAWALLRAYKRWGDSSYFLAAKAIAIALGKNAVLRQGSDLVLLPGTSGFGVDDRDDGPVVNLSYWVFPAIDELAIFAPEFPADQLIASGLSLIARAQIGPAKLPADWTSLKDNKPAAADGFKATFGYDAVRIPLYLAWFGAPARSLLEPFAKRWAQGSKTPMQVIDIESGEAVAPFGDAGYLAIADLVLCSVGDAPIGNVAQNFNLTRYYPSTLDMLSLLAMVERYPQCLAAQ